MFLPPSPHYPVCGPTLRGSLESERPKGQRGVYHRILLSDREQKRGMSPFCCPSPLPIYALSTAPRQGSQYVLQGIFGARYRDQGE